MERSLVRTILDKREGYLRRHLVLSKTVINKLQENGIITEVTRNLMKSQPSMLQLDNLMDILRKSDVNTFRKFLRALKDTHNNWIAETVLDTPIGDTLFKDKIRFGYTDDFDSNFRESLSNEIVRYEPPRHRSDVGRMDRLARYREEIIPDIFGQSVPRQIYGLHVVFDEHRSNAEKSLAMLRQEEVAIRELLYQNAREQNYVRQNQRDLYDIDYRLQELHQKSKELDMRPSPPVRNARKRLSQLHKIT